MRARAGFSCCREAVGSGWFPPFADGIKLGEVNGGEYYEHENIMNTSEHTFPLPENVAHKLEEVEHALELQPLHLKAQDFVRANPWQVLAAASIVGFLLGICLRRRVL